MSFIFTCGVQGCSSAANESNDSFKFFRVPANPVTAERWQTLAGRQDMELAAFRRMYICQKHFQPDCFRKDLKRLKNSASPCVNLAQNKTLTVNRGTQYENLAMDVFYTDTRQDCKLNRDTFYNLCDEFLNKEIAKIVKEQVDFKFKFAGEKYDSDFKYFCLKFYYTCPASYLALQPSMNLLDKKSLMTVMMTTFIGEHDKLSKILYAKFECMSPLEKNAVLLVGFTDVKPHYFYHISEDKVYGFTDNCGTQSLQPACGAIVLIARGIYEPWILPIDYVLLPAGDENNIKNVISSWLYKTIHMLLHVGLNIRICISNLSADAITKDSAVHKVTREQPFFFVESKQIYYMKDPTITIKKIHKHFMRHDVYSHDWIAKWKNIVEFYDLDSKKKYRLASALRAEHVRPTGNEIPFSSVLNTFSEAVAAGMSAYVDSGQMEQEARGTVLFLSIMSRMIDFTRSSNAPNCSEFKRPFTGSDNQMDLIYDALAMFRDFENNADNLEFVTDIQIAIRSLLLLNEDLTLENYPKLFTKNINFNTMTIFFDLVSKKNCKSGQILPWRLVDTFRTNFCRYLVNTPKYRDCPEALSGVFFEYLHKVPKDQKALKNENEGLGAFKNTITTFKNSDVNMPVKISDYKDFKIPSKNQLQAISAFVLKKCLEKHSTCVLPKKMGRKKVESIPSCLNRYPQFTMGSEPDQVIPDQGFLRLIAELENDLKVHCDTHMMSSFWMLKLMQFSRFTGDSYQRPCHCFPVVYLTKLYFRIRLSQILKMNNKIFKTTSLQFASYRSLPYFKYIKPSLS
ncbi:uncharacterized protein LOC135078615 [Ostrinia nubilalis]|uniref:uncharacterized protein LOC135078615 n=1 Tax=Ostrinia nubilalis TaxID=29057 RepID=UPI0030823357